MTNKEMVKIISQMQNRELSILESKNLDYAGSEDAFKNFTLSSKLSGVSVERSILVRICDKISRLSNLVDNNSRKVTEETLEDTINDARNYLGILFAFRMGQVDEGETRK